VLCERIGPRAPALNHAINPGEASTDVRQLVGTGDAFGRELRRDAFEHAADLDAVVNVADRELRRDEPAGRPRRHEAFLFEAAEHEREGRARHVKARGQRNLADPFAGTELAAHEQLAHLQERPQGLGLVAPGPPHASITVARQASVHAASKHIACKTTTPARPGTPALPAFSTVPSWRRIWIACNYGPW